MKKEQQLKQAQELQAAGNIEDALAIYQAILKEDPQDSNLIHNISVLYAQLKQYEKALESIDRAIKLDGNNAVYLITKGNILLRQNNIEAAIIEYQKAVKLDPSYAHAYNNLGNAYYRMDQLTTAEQYYQKAIQIKPQYIDAHFNYSLLLIKLGNLDEAKKQLEQTLRLQPQHPYALGQFAEIYLLQGNITEAITFFIKRLEMQPYHVTTLYKLGIAYLQSSQFPEAIQSFKKVLQLDERHPDANYDLASAYLKSGNYENALAYYLRQLEIRSNAETYYNIGVLLMYQERNQEAIQYFKEALNLDPNYLPTHLNLGATFLKANRAKEAVPYYQSALQLKPDDAEIQHILNALTQSNTPDHAPSDYLEHLFDQYAHIYDQHLTRHLEYKVPELLFDAIHDETGITQPSLIILDLGCGTGLCGEYFKKISKKLIGVDISKEMIEVAKNKPLYDELQVADIQTVLDQYSNIDLVLAADVFTYIGNLATIFKKVYTALTDEGIFGFSVEKTHVEPYLLQQSIRYAHSKNYLATLIKENNFQILRFDQIILRKQRNHPVEGFLVVLKKLMLSQHAQ